MSQFKVGDSVVVISQSRVRRIVSILGDRALCKSFVGGQEDWFPLTDLKPNDRRPMRPFIG